MSELAEVPVGVSGGVHKRKPRPETWHHLAAFAFPLLCLWAALWIGGGVGVAHAVVAFGCAHVVLVGNVWIALPRPKASISNTMLGVALEPVRHVAVPLALFGVTTVVAAYVGAMVGEKPDLAASFEFVAWFLGAAALVVVLIAVPYVFWRARALSGKQLRTARRALAKPLINPFKSSTVPIDLESLAVRPVGEYALWLATSKGGRNLMWLALAGAGYASWIVSSGSAG